MPRVWSCDGLTGILIKSRDYTILSDLGKYGRYVLVKDKKAAFNTLEGTNGSHELCA